jgi:two-component system, chemotaxis family, chemotaxis protein CheY
MGKYILVVDDSPTIRVSVEFALKAIGLPVEQAENGVEALKKIKTLTGKGDAIAMGIIDVNMPQMDGISFIKNFRKDDKFTPLIVLTTESEEHKIQEGKNAGASGWIVKPFQPAELLGVVQRFIR